MGKNIEDTLREETFASSNFRVSEKMRNIWQNVCRFLE